MDIKVLNAEHFAPYGMIIPTSNAKDVSFDIKLKENASGWRIAILEITNRTTKQLHCHPDSLEVFEVISGSAVLLVATAENPDNVEAFLLDKPVCVNKGVWHSTIALSEKATVKITENSSVSKNTHDICEVKPIVFTGALALNGSIFDLGLLIFFGFLGYILREVGYQPASLAIGVILGPIIEKSLTQSLILFDGKLSSFFARPFSGAFLGLAIIILLAGIYGNLKKYFQSQKKTGEILN